jgi:DNA replication and repair protein RecF
MLFDFLKVNNVRNISNVHITPSAGLNLVVGPNASGKTALLEAIHLLARARSFRTPRIKEVIQRGQETLQVSAQISKKKIGTVATGIEKSYGTTVIRFAGEPLKTVSEQANNIPLIIITPDSHNLVTGSPNDRRHWLDWAMFHVEPSYITVWRKYQKALRNRNNLLKYGKKGQEIVSWESGMLTAANALNELRGNFIKVLQYQLAITVQGSFSIPPTLKFSEGCPDNLKFEDYLEKDREKDRQLGYTRYGPHRADVLFLTENSLITQSFSRGQIKKYIVALLVAQALSYESINEEKPVFLIDDYAAELDVDGQEQLLDLLRRYGGQTFLTSTEAEEELKGASMFHVERGNFYKVVK